MSRQETYGARQGPAPSNLGGDPTAVKAAEPKTLEEIRKGGGGQAVSFQAILVQVMKRKTVASANYEGQVLTAFVGDGSCL
jgi:hypothetical protein